MKKLFTLLASITLSVMLFAQTPNSFSYQTIIRDASWQVLSNQNISLQISIIEDVPNGTAIYTESHSATTNQLGLVNLAIGEGVVMFGSWSNINWGNHTYFIEIAVDVTAGVNYIVMGTTQLRSVPYSLHSNTADSIVGGVSIVETDPLFEVSIANGITASDTSNWNNDAQLDPQAIANMGFMSGTPTIEYKKLFLSSSGSIQYMANLSWIQIYTSGNELIVKVPNTAASSIMLCYAVNNDTPIIAAISVGDSVSITGLTSKYLELNANEYSNIVNGGVLNWTGLGMSNGWHIGHVMYED